MATTDIDVRELEQRGIDVIRGLSMDAVQRANSGHPGTPMALAPLAHVLFTRIMKYDAERARVARPRPVRPVERPRVDAPLLAALPHRLRPHARRPARLPAVGLEDGRATPSTRTCPASRSPPDRSARASPTASASVSPRPTCAPGSARRSSTTTRSCSAATATSRRASATRRRRSPVTSGWDASPTSTTTTTSPSTDPPSSRTPTTCPSGSRPTAGTWCSWARSPTTSTRSSGASGRRWPRPPARAWSCCAATSGTRRPSTPTPPRLTARRSVPTRWPR